MTSLPARPANPRAAAYSAGWQAPFELQELWFMLMRWPWRSLAVVPADAHGSATDLARALADLGRQYRGERVTFLEANADDLASAAGMVLELEARESAPAASTAQRTATPEVVIALQPLITHPLGIPLAVSADAVLLVVQLGATDLVQARKTVELVGRERIVGAVLQRRA